MGVWPLGLCRRGPKYFRVARGLRWERAQWRRPMAGGGSAGAPVGVALSLHCYLSGYTYISPIGHRIILPENIFFVGYQQGAWWEGVC